MHPSTQRNDSIYSLRLWSAHLLTSSPVLTFNNIQQQKQATQSKRAMSQVYMSDLWSSTYGSSNALIWTISIAREEIFSP